MSLPPPQDNYVGEPQYPSPWTTKQPREGLRDTDQARIICLAPDVCLTPVGNSVVPIPYSIVDYCGHDQGYTPSVRFTGLKAMVLRSSTTHVHGDAPGTRKGVKSGTVEDICEPIGHAAHVRAEGSNVIRHLDRFWMNSRNTVGEAIFVRDTGTYPAPEDDDPVPGSLRLAGGEPVLVAQAATGTMTDAGGGLLGGTATGSGTTAQPGSQAPTRPTTAPRSPGLVRRGILGLIISEIARDLSMSPEEAAAEARANMVLLSPRAEAVIRDQRLLGGRQIVTPSNIFDADTWDFSGKYGVFIGPEERIPLANDVLGALAGRPVDVRTMTNAEVQTILASENAEADEEEGNGVRVTNRRQICFDLPPGMDREEFERQLKEQEDAINNMTADEMGYAHWVLDRAGTTRLLRDAGAQRDARNNYATQLRSQGYSRSEIARIMASVNATHFLDIVAGGDPWSVGIGAADVNQEIGRQWIRGGRVQALRDEAERMRQAGQSQEKMNVELTIC